MYGIYCKGHKIGLHFDPQTAPSGRPFRHYQSDLNGHYFRYLDEKGGGFVVIVDKFNNFVSIKKFE